MKKIFHEEGYGFLETLEGRQIYLHENSVLHRDFERLRLGTGVYFTEESGEEGPQGVSIEITDKPGARIGDGREEYPSPPTVVS